MGSVTILLVCTSGKAIVCAKGVVYIGYCGFLLSYITELVARGREDKVGASPVTTRTARATLRCLCMMSVTFVCYWRSVFEVLATWGAQSSQCSQVFGALLLSITQKRTTREERRRRGHKAALISRSAA